MLYWLCEKSDRPGPPTWPQLEHAICRNFGGLDDQDFDPLEEFRKRIPNREDPDLIHEVSYNSMMHLYQAFYTEFGFISQRHSVANPDSSPLGLIKASLRTKETSWHG